MSRDAANRTAIWFDATRVFQRNTRCKEEHSTQSWQPVYFTTPKEHTAAFGQEINQVGNFSRGPHIVHYNYNIIPILEFQWQNKFRNDIQIEENETHTHAPTHTLTYKRHVTNID